MSTDASFQRREVGEAVHFDVVPARQSIGFVLLFGPVSIIGLVIIAVIGAAIGEAFSRQSGGFLGGLAALAVGGVVLWVRIWRNYFASRRGRQPVTLTVDAAGLHTAAGPIALRDVAEFNVRRGIDGPGATPVYSASTVIVTGGAANVAAGAAGHAATQLGLGVVNMTAKARDAQLNALADRSLVLTVRSRRGSGSTVLAQGLTADCAQALMNDLAETVGEALQAQQARAG
jgi:hypothetical protein